MLLPVQPRLEHRGVFGTSEAPLTPPPGTFDLLGGREAVALVVDGLYDRIERDRLLRPAFVRDLTHEREKQKRFFEAWLGGDPGYFDDTWSQQLPPGRSRRQPRR
ncbi:MAG: Bacterial-like globin [Armatimonadetes bacterium]|jgi:truncated hemoglobin YjbI|nr:Bacterial-like globin [Armatimonadota bacterium]